MSLCINRIRSFFCVAYILLSLSCSAHADAPTQKFHVMHIDRTQISVHEQYVASAQQRYRYIKPLLTLGGVSLVLFYVWYTSKSLSDEEMVILKNLIAERKKQDILQKDWVSWSRSSLGSVSDVAVKLIGGALIIPPLSEIVGKLTGCAHVVSSIDVYDQGYTHCNALVMQLVRDMQLSIDSQTADKSVLIGIPEMVNTCNRLIQRLEKLLGFMRVEARKFNSIVLWQEAVAIEKRLVAYADELCNDMQHIIDEPVFAYEVALNVAVQFAQRYVQEMQRFAFLEQDAQMISRKA